MMRYQEELKARKGIKEKGMEEKKEKIVTKAIEDKCADERAMRELIDD